MKDAIILVTKPGLGTTSPEDAAFGGEMLDKFFHTLESLTDKPKAICFYTEGVKLLAKGSPVELGLKVLASEGVRLLACQTCLDYYELGDKLGVGELVGMNEIVTLMSEASKVVTI